MKSTTHPHPGYQAVGCDSPQALLLLAALLVGSPTAVIAGNWSDANKDLQGAKAGSDVQAAVASARE